MSERIYGLEKEFPQLTKVDDDDLNEIATTLTKLRLQFDDDHRTVNNILVIFFN